MLQLEQSVQLAEKEAEKLRVTLEERESNHNIAIAEQEQQLRHWAQELATECEHLHLLVEQRGAKQNTLQLPARYASPYCIWFRYSIQYIRINTL